MPPLNPPNSPSEYWRSLGDLERTPEFQAFLEREFPEDAQGPIGETTRRQFLKLMGASIALAGLTSCRWPEEKIAPFAHRPDGRVPGAPQYFATARELHGVGTGLVVTSYDGRPIKIEGNPLHPQSLGAADVWAQAGLLEMYDPERSRRVMHRAGSQRLVKTGEDFAEFSREMFAKLRDSKGAGLCVLSEASESPSVKDLRDRVAREMPAARWVEYEAVSPDNQRAGSALAFGRPLREHVNYAGAKVVVALDADPLMTHPAAVRNARDFAEGRQPAEGRMSRLYVFENSYTITGTMADHRYPTAAAAIPRVAAHLAADVAKLRLDDSTARFEPLEALARFEKLPEELAPLAAIARDLMKYRGQCAVVAGPRQPARVHALVAWINVELRNYGQTITLTEEPYPERTSHAEALKALADDMRGGKVETLLILGGNPVYTAPPDLEFAAVLAKVPTTLHLSLYDDETSRLCAWHVPRAHYLESWGDTRAFDGTVAITQPLIAPLYDGKTPTELLENLLSDTPASGHEVVRRTFKQNFGEAEFDSRWSHALEDGVVKDSAYPAVAAPPMNRESIDGHLASLAPSAPALSKDNLELVFARDLKVLDGRFANNGWLQEMPDPITKLTWDNALLAGPATLKALGIKDQDVVTVSTAGKTLDLPVYLTPGQAPFSLTITLGYGRRAAGTVGDGVGFDAYPLRPTGGIDIAAGVTLKPTGQTHRLVTTQDHFAIDRVGIEERARRSPTLIRETTLAEFAKDPHLIKEAEPHAADDAQLFTTPRLAGHQWAMAIDLNVCIGCNACVIACQAENNIPVVGKEQVHRNREMHWLRVDRYFRGDPDNPASVHQPLMCVHCENAPCEEVCPVGATVHTDEGLNMMVYNRCIGTRYCSNNCPFKVRHFNFFNYHKRVAETAKLMYNPEVTVRSRGVMEKCTYCLQRIEAVKIAAKNERRAIRDGEIRTACQQTCPTQAIVFGDLTDTESKVVRRHADPRAYGMLGELLVKPRTLYLGRVRNPNPELAATSPEDKPTHAA